MQDSLASVDPDAQTVTTGDGVQLPYDELVLAVGARPRQVVPGAIGFGDPADAGAVAAVVEGIRAGTISRVGLTGADGISWTLPMYELALGLAAECGPDGTAPKIFVVTPEERPLDLFGTTVSEAVGLLLEQRGVQVLTAATVERVEDGAMWVELEGAVDVDAAIALPRLSGPAIDGIPHDRQGFVAVDEYSRVLGLSHVYAAGDMCADPIKQGGLAAQRADAAAAQIAFEQGAGVLPPPFDPVLRAILATGDQPRFLRAHLAGADAADGISREPQWWPPAKIAARELAPYLATHLLHETQRPAVEHSRSRAAPAHTGRAILEPPVIRPLSELSLADREFAGGLGAGLAEEARLGIPVAPGFVVGAPAYEELCEAGDLRLRLAFALVDAGGEELGRLMGEAALARSYVAFEPLPERLAAELEEAHAALVGDRPDAPLTVTASFTEPDLPQLPPGDDDVFRDVRGAGALEAAVRHCWSSLFDVRRVRERARRCLPPVDIAVAVVVQVQDEDGGA